MSRARLSAPGRRLFVVGDKTPHWVPKGWVSVCGKLDVKRDKAKKVATIAGFLPYGVCKTCLKAMLKDDGYTP